MRNGDSCPLAAQNDQIGCTWIFQLQGPALSLCKAGGDTLLHRSPGCRFPPDNRAEVEAVSVNPGQGLKSLNAYLVPDLNAGSLGLGSPDTFLIMLLA